VELGFRLNQYGASFVFVDSARSLEDDRKSLRDAMREREARGRLQLLKLEMYPSLLPHLHIGGHGEVSRWSFGLRRVLLAMRVPPALLVPLAAVIPGDCRVGKYYSLLLSYAEWVGVRKVADRDTWRRLQRGAIILAYHAIAREGEPTSRFVVSEERFHSQMEWLKRAGYHVIALDELVRCMREYRLPPAKSVVLTFDDGYRDNLELAVPVVERFGYPWTLFLPSSAGASNGWSEMESLQGRELIDIHEAPSFGRGSVGAHGRTHVDLVAIPPTEAEREIVGSKAELEGALGRPVTSFAYPYGRTSDEVRHLVQDAGFESACTTVPGPNRPATDPYMLHRYEIDGRDSLLRFATLLSVGDIRVSLFRRLR
jgi:peptidoglycan/xylan/chitin deacetylase (PgdA/CDA1 family)